jgi:hypothetical protein
MSNPPSQKEFEDILKAWRQCRKEHSSGRPFFMLVQWVPIGANGGGRVVCRPVLSPVRVEQNGNRS